MKKGFDSLLFIFEVLLFISTGYSIGNGNIYQFILSLACGLIVAFWLGDRLIKEGKELATTKTL